MTDLEAELRRLAENAVSGNFRGEAKGLRIAADLVAAHFAKLDADKDRLAQEGFSKLAPEVQQMFLREWLAKPRLPDLDKPAGSKVVFPLAQQLLDAATLPPNAEAAAIAAMEDDA